MSNQPEPKSAGATVSGDPTTSPTTRRKRRKLTWKMWVAFLSIPYILLGLVLLGIEVYVRATRPHVPTLQVFVDVIMPGMSTDKEKNHVFRGDPWLSWALIPNLKDVWWDYTTFSTNSQGIRYPTKVGSKPRDMTRIICMGDSVTFGYRIPQTFPQSPMGFEDVIQPYPAHVEKLLNEGLPEKAFEVIPLAAPGYSSHQGKVWLERDIGKFDPDIVTILYGFNDTSLLNIEDKKNIPTDKLMRFQRWLMMRSQAMIYLSRWMEEKRRARAAAEVNPQAPPPMSGMQPRVSKEDYVANIVEMVRIAKEYGSKVVVISPVYRDRIHQPDQSLLFMDYARRLAEAAKQENFPLLKMDSIDMSAWPINNPMYGEAIHPAYEGHHVMANELLHFLKSEKILP